MGVWDRPFKASAVRSGFWLEICFLFGVLAKLFGFCMLSLLLAQALPNSGCLSTTPVLSKLEPGSAIKDGELFLSFPS